jgi:hypothetical protein
MIFQIRYVRSTLADEERERLSINTGEFLQFHYIYPALAGFTLRHERLGSA